MRAWVDAYESAWRNDDVAAVEALFDPDVSYRTSPYAVPRVGHDAVKAFWLDDQGEPFTMSHRVIATEGSIAVVEVSVHYLPPVDQEYRDLWVMRFAADGRVADFEEWAYWPDTPHSASSH